MCQVHGGGAQPSPDNVEALISRALALISQVNSYLANVQTLPDTDRLTLLSNITDLQSAVSSRDADAINTAMSALKTNYEVLSELYPLPIVSGSDEPGPTPTPAPTPEPTEEPPPPELTDQPLPSPVPISRP